MTKYHLAIYGFLILLLTACNLTFSAIPGIAPDYGGVLEATPTPTATATNTPTPTLTPTRQVVIPPTAIIPCTVRTDWLIYSVVAGDTLSKIAGRVNSTVDALVRANCLANPNSIYVGQTLRVPSLPPLQARIVSFVVNTGYPPRLEWRTENASQVLLYAGGTNKAAQLYGTYSANGSLDVPLLGAEYGPIAHFILNIKDASGNVVVGANGLPVSQRVEYGIGGIELPCPAVSDVGTGVITITPGEARGGRCTAVNNSQTVTVSWQNMPAGLASIEYYFVPNHANCGAIGNPNVIGTVLLNGIVPPETTSVSWYVGNVPCSGVLYAFGYGTEQGSMVESMASAIVIR